MKNHYLNANGAGNAVAAISLKKIKENFAYLKKLAFPAIPVPVLKANAYGLGIKEIASVLGPEIGACFVATAAEAIILKKYFINHLNKKIRIFVLHGFLPGESSKFVEHDLTPVINSSEQAQEWLENGGGAPCAIQLDTGMNRLGILASEIQAPIFQKLNAVLILSHLSCSEDRENPSNQQQLKIFNEITQKFFPGIPKSIAASGGIFLGKDFHLDIVRPGIALYGQINNDKAGKLRNTVSIHAPIYQISRHARGEYFGYGSAWKAKRETISATVGIGYADCCLSSRKQEEDKKVFLWKDDFAFPIIGKCSMDSVIIDITDAPNHLRLGDFVELLGEKQDILTLAECHAITPHEVLTSIGNRVVKIYHTH